MRLPGWKHPAGAPVTRAQFACALVRLAEEPLPEPARDVFVPGDHWACAQIGKLTAWDCCRSETAAGSCRLPQSAGGSRAACWTRWRTRRRAARYFRR
ncbi:MAG: hypothetical protein ACLTGM_03305 [Oscillospiraceae bacterium]